jgi:hypothetical protein
LKKISVVDDFWSWSRDKLSQSLRANAWYNNGQPFGLAGYLNDFSSRMIGYATLRQLRVKNSKNEVFFKKFNIRMDNLMIRAYLYKLFGRFV